MLVALERLYYDLRDTSDEPIKKKRVVPLLEDPDEDEELEETIPAKISTHQKAMAMISCMRCAVELHNRQDRLAFEEEKRSFEEKIQMLEERVIRLTDMLSTQRPASTPSVH